jgi:hypothetical protein
MKAKILILLVGVILVASVDMVLATEPTALTNGQMDGVTAGLLVSSSAFGTAEGNTAATSGAASGAAVSVRQMNGGTVFSAATSGAASAAALSQCCQPASAHAETSSLIIYP